METTGEQGINAEQNGQSGASFYSHGQMKQKVGVSNLKLFDGEDLTAGNRKRLQQLQQRDWIEQQIREKEERKKLVKDTLNAYDTQTLHITSMAQSLEKSENDKRKDLLKSVKETNLQQAAEKYDKNVYDRNVGQQDSTKHIEYCTTNVFQTENTATCQSQLAPHRVIPYHWKGMNNEQKTDILLTQDQQREENQRIKEFQKEEEKLFALQTEQLRNMQINLDRERERRLKQELLATQEYNLKAAEEARLRRKNQYQ